MGADTSPAQWDEFQDRVRTRVNTKTWQTWLEPLEAEVSDGVLRLEAPSDFHRRWVRDRFLPVPSKRAVSQVYGDDVTVILDRPRRRRSPDNSRRRRWTRPIVTAAARTTTVRGGTTAAAGAGFGHARGPPGAGLQSPGSSPNTPSRISWSGSPIALRTRRRWPLPNNPGSHYNPLVHLRSGRFGEDPSCSMQSGHHRRLMARTASAVVQVRVLGAVLQRVHQRHPSQADG